MGVPQLPPELWQDIVDLLCCRGHAMHDMRVREDMCALRLSSRLLRDITTPVLYAHVFLQSRHGLRSYVASFPAAGEATKTPGRPLPRILCLLGFVWPRSLDRSALLDKLDRVTRLALLVGGPSDLRSSDLPLTLEDYAGQMPLPGLPSHGVRQFDRLERLCLIDATFENAIGFSLACPNLKDVVLVFPSSLDSLATPSVFERLRQRVLERRSDPRITVLSALARTIDDPGFGWIQRSNTLLDNLARSIHMVDLQLYRLMSDHEGLAGHEAGTALHTEVSPFSLFVERSVCDGSLYDYCRNEGRRCGQSSGLGLALVPW